VVFRPLAAPGKGDCWIAWHRENQSKVPSRYIEIVKKEARAWRRNQAMTMAFLSTYSIAPNTASSDSVANVVAESDMA